MKTKIIVFSIILAVLIFVVVFIRPMLKEERPEPVIDPSAPGVHYYTKCDYEGWHRHTDEAPSEVDVSFKSVRVTDDFFVKALSTTDEEVFIKGPSTVKCTEFKSMEVLPN
jgi:hypothetical protein